jgi:parallel beta-helix repeat protein
VSPGESIQAALDAVGSGGTVCIRGEHRITTSLRPRTGQTIAGDGAILNGTRTVTNWTLSGGLWVATGQVQSISDVSSGGSKCEMNPMACQFEDLFFDDQPLVRVAAVTGVTPGRWYFDEATDRIYLGQDPTGHQVEVTSATHGMQGGGASSVTLTGIVFEKFAHYGLDGAGPRWLVTRNEFRYNHSHGFRFGGTGGMFSHNYIHHNGQMGFSGSGIDVVFEENHLAFNNYLRFGTTTGYWHAGATKVRTSTNVVVRNNYSHDNIGDGWWFDWDNYRMTFEGNLIEDNSRCGLLYEASFDGVIRNNTFRDNGMGTLTADRCWASVFLNTSKNIAVTGNTFVGKGDGLNVVSVSRGTSTIYGLRQSTGLTVHNNTFRPAPGYFAVAVPYGKTTMPTDSKVDQNRYVASDTSARWWSWRSGPVTWSEWRGYGHDLSGSVATS